MADECEGIVPAALPAPVVAPITDPQASDVSCLSGVGDDGDGTLLLGYEANLLAPPEARHMFFQIRNGSAAPVGATIRGGDESVQQILSQPSGFSEFTISTQTGGSSLANWSHDGVLVSSAQIAPFAPRSSDPSPISAIGVDPSGGTAAVKSVFANGSWTTTYQRFDKNGVAETAEVQIDSGQHVVVAVGVALSGHALILMSFQLSSWEARWVARDGSPIAGPFTVPAPAGNRFQFLLDGSLALGSVQDFSEPPTSFVSRIEDGATVAGPLPDWLQARSGNQLYAVRSGKAYASWGSGGQCGSDLELVATSGKSCGCVKVPRLTRSASVGRDGSLIVPDLGSSPRCSYDLYPKLLR